MIMLGVRRFYCVVTRIHRFGVVGVETTGRKYSVISIISRMYLHLCCRLVSIDVMLMMTMSSHSISEMIILFIAAQISKSIFNLDTLNKE